MQRHIKYKCVIQETDRAVKHFLETALHIQLLSLSLLYVSIIKHVSAIKFLLPYMI